MREAIGTVADIAFLVSLGVGAVIAAVVGAYLTLPKAGTGWALLAGFGALLIVTGALRFGWHWSNTRIDPIGEESYLSAKRIRLTDLAVPEDPIVRGRTLEKCRLFGPGVVVLSGGLMSGSTFDGDPKDMFIEVPEDWRTVGVIVLVDCVVKDCRFHNIAIAGTAEQIVKYKKGFTVVT